MSARAWRARRQKWSSFHAERYLKRENRRRRSQGLPEYSFAVALRTYRVTYSVETEVQR